jgi:conjugal transfer pilus assembly protein TraW
VILGKLRAAGEDGTLARLQRESLARSGEASKTRAGGRALAHPSTARFHHDPSIVVQDAILDADGRVIVPPGTVVNPLDTVSLEPGAALHRCARSRAGQTRARNSRRAQGKVKVILTGGSYLDLMRRWKRPVFYDQQGTLTDEARHPSGAGARHPGRQEAAHR